MLRDMSGERHKAIIVGAGIGGPVLGLCLQRLGMEVVLTEAREAVASTEGAFLGVAPNGMNALAELGLASAVAAVGHPCTGFEFRNRSDRAIGAIDRSADVAQFGWPLTMVRRGDLHAVLARAAEERGLPIRFGKRLVAIDVSRPEWVTARFADGSEERGDILIGADGLRSTVRALAMPEAPAPSLTGLLDFGGFARVQGLPFAPGVNEMVFGRRAFFGAFTTPSGETWWFHNGPPPPPGDAADVRARMLALHTEDPTWIRDVIEATPTVLGPWPIHELRAMKRWSRGRVCLIGDAAHAMSPSAGQGASLAFEDAMVLAKCLRDGTDPAAAFVAFERERRPRVDAIFRAAQRNGSGKATSNAMSEWFRDRMLPFFLRMGAKGQTESYAFRVAW